ncbi:MAG: rod shape-determining protein MreC [Xanthomonadales bacterium]|uniref:rod shape-determining protein MreC n=2 Tax=Dokdonella sp. TaxID=2291710 RepID=UPI002BE9B836|nr:rod shape-determining protein MreC [Xanthomonadales bacterium]HQV71559.1 rod shape-determining protein MreC [Dokdonella sp.]MBK7013712.1 rod shape-determining protein MreC [Xanthomonadales bacterium]MBK7209531.1 rod shape-determining protein MreC [Xanthomonadales bacterium]MBL0223260.1 rod shape-determining protein MreC [Xanthomonadales bacterium]
MPLSSPDKVSLFAEGAVSTARLIAYLTLAMIVMVVDHRGNYLEHLRAVAGTLVEPVYRMAALPSDVARAGRLAVATQTQLVDENRDLREALLLAQVRLNRMSALTAQNDRLKKLLDVQNELGLGVQLARLIDIDLDPFRHRVVLDAGSAQMIKVGQPVLDAFGIMGQIVEVLPNTSVALLITDPTHAIPVMVRRTGLRTIAYGTGAIDRLQLPNIPISADIKVGDELVTSGLGGRFPMGFEVGRIVEISNDESGMFAAATAKPAAALDRSGEVLLLQDLPQPMGPPAPEETPAPDAAAASSSPEPGR